jgi:hypothetical protein
MMLTVPLSGAASGDATAVTRAPLPRATCTKSARTPPGTAGSPRTAAPSGTPGSIRRPAWSVTQARAAGVISSGTFAGMPSAGSRRTRDGGRVLNVWSSARTGYAFGSARNSRACTSVRAAAPSASATDHCSPSVSNCPTR